MNEAENYVREMANVSIRTIRATRGSLSKDDIENVVQMSAHLAKATLFPGAFVDEVILVRKLETFWNVTLDGTPDFLEDDAGHVEWLEARRSEIDWDFWERLETFFADVEGLPGQVIESTDSTTDFVLGRLENPQRPGPWDRRGLVAGQVQSGKTGHYTALICKALDAGYKVIVVLAGLHNSLRSQTQGRLDEGVRGIDSGKALTGVYEGGAAIGVGLLGGANCTVHSFTSVTDAGDFKKDHAGKLGFTLSGADPTMFVVKKNKTILTNLISWIKSSNAVTDPDTGKHQVPAVPLLVIDDEADQASVDVRKKRKGSDEYDPSVINGLIRKLLESFEQSSYVGYTATPFANIFINPRASHEESGDDLFPHAFILRLPAPSNYVGPVKVFGLQEDDELGIEERKPLPIVRTVDDYSDWIPEKHRKDLIPGSQIPPSLQEALDVFLLGAAIRRFRGQAESHHSMLVHVTRFTAVQHLVHEQILDAWDAMKHELYAASTDSTLLTRLRHLFETDIAATSRTIAHDPDFDDQSGRLPSWGELGPMLYPAAKKVQIWRINGSSKEALEYRDHPNGLSVIAVGGDKLSRGLTLAGLTVSYYLRTSNAYDTLMQMGRWFGYRPDYLDVCRLYTTDELQRRYEAITEASEELYREFHYMHLAHKTPDNFGLRVRQHPLGLTVTAPNKLRHAKEHEMSYADTTVDSVVFDRRQSPREANWDAMQTLVRTMQETQALSQPSGGLYVWHSVPAQPVIDFFRGYQAHAGATAAQPKLLADYITQRLADGGLGTWTVALAASGDSDADDRSFDALGTGRRLPLTWRASVDGQVKPVDRYTVKRVGSPTHELADLTRGTALWQSALDETIADWKASTRKNKRPTEPTQPSAAAARHHRSRNEGLLVLYPLNPMAAEGTEKNDKSQETPFVGFVVSFPPDGGAKPLTYKINMVAYEQLFLGEDAEGDDDD